MVEGFQNQRFRKCTRYNACEAEFKGTQGNGSYIILNFKVVSHSSFRSLTTPGAPAVHLFIRYLHIAHWLAVYPDFAFNNVGIKCT